MERSAQERDEGTIKLAIRTFREHHLIQGDREHGRWLIARKYDNGTLRGEYATEVISLWGGRLFVGGDIDDCVFGYYSAPKDIPPKDLHERKLSWIGRCQDVRYYVAQKARIGLSDNGRLTASWDTDVARYQLREALEDEDLHDKDRKAFEEVLRWGEIDEQEAISFLYGNMYEPYNMPGDLGKVTATRVIYCWAACRKLCQILDGPAENDRYAKYDQEDNEETK